MRPAKWNLFALAALAAAFCCGAASAQEPGEAGIDALIAATDSDAGALALARQQAGAGDLTGAATTLERSLLLRSGSQSDEVRLYYATVLCRLGDPRRGAYQISNVRNAAVPGWTEARQACGSAPVSSVRSDGNGLSGEVSLGVRYESDAYGALVIQFETPGIPAPTAEGGAIVGAAALEGRFASSPSGHGYAGASLFTSNGISGPDIDYQIGALRAGYSANLGARDRRLAGGAVIRHAIVTGDAFLTEYGVQAEYGFASGSVGRWAFNAEAVDQDYRSALLPTERDGGHYEVAASYHNQSSPGRVWAAGVAIESKDAELTEFGYVAGRVFAAAQMPISDGDAYFRASGTLRMADYGDVSGIPDRRETRMHLRAGIGIPLAREGLFVEAAATYAGRWYDTASQLYDYSSVGAELRLVYRFGQ